MEDFICDVKLLDDCGNVVHAHPGMVMEWGHHAGKGWYTTAPITFSSGGRIVTITDAGIYVGGEQIWTIPLGVSVNVGPADTLTVQPSNMTVGFSDSEVANDLFLKLLKAHSKLPTQEEIDNTILSLQEIERGLNEP